MRRTRIPEDEWQYRDRSSELVRGTLLRLTAEFVRAARGVSGIERIAVVGSLVSDKARPKDADVLVTVSANTDYRALARAGRQFQGRAQQINSTADIFLCDPALRYLGRICHYRECYRRRLCFARHCGAQPGVADDLDVIQLPHAALASPPLVVYPHVVSTTELPADVLDLLVRPFAQADIPQ